MKLFLDAGADVNAAPSSTNGNLEQTLNFSYAYSTSTVLRAAVELGDLTLINLLLDHGADINAPAGEDKDATALQLAAIQGFIGIARMLPLRGADCNAPAARHHGRTALQGAAEHERIDMTRLLLEFCTDIHGPGRSQYIQAVHFALENGHAAAAKVLQTQGDWSDQDNVALAD